MNRMRREAGPSLTSLRFLGQSSGEAMDLSHWEAPSKALPEGPSLNIPIRGQVGSTFFLETFILRQPTWFFSETFLCSRLCGDGGSSRAGGHRDSAPHSGAFAWASPVTYLPSTIHSSAPIAKGHTPALSLQFLPLARSLFGSHKEVPITRCPSQAPGLSLLFPGPRQIQKSVVGRQRTC